MNIESRRGESEPGRFIAPITHQTFELLQFSALIGGCNRTDAFNRAIQAFASWKVEDAIGKEMDGSVELLYVDSEEKNEPTKNKFRLTNAPFSLFICMFFLSTIPSHSIYLFFPFWVCHHPPPSFFT